MHRKKFSYNQLVPSEEIDKVNMMNLPTQHLHVSTWIVKG